MKSFTSRAAADAYLESCRVAGVKPDGTIRILANRFRVKRELFPRRPQSQADSERLRAAEMKRRRKGTARMVNIARKLVREEERTA